MRTPLNKRLKRDLKSNAGRYFSMALLLFATIAVIASFLVVAAGVADTYYQNHLDSKVEDGQFTSATPIDNEVLDNITKLDVAVYENYYVEMDVLEDTTLRIYQDRENINLASILEGEFPKAKNEIALDRLYAENNELNIGDTITVDNQEMMVTGFVSLPDYSSLFKNNADLMMDSFHFGVAIVTEETFTSFHESDLNYNYAYYLDDRNLTENEKRDKADEIKEQLVKSQVQLTNFLIAEDNQSISFVADDMGSDVPLMKVVLFIIIAIMAFVFSIVIRSTIEGEAAIIGTLLASGYSKYEILWHYMTLPILITAVSAVLGNIVAYTGMIDTFANLYYTTYSLPNLIVSFNLEALLLTTVLPLCMILVINFITLRKALSISPLNFLRKDLKKRGSKKAFHLPNFKFITRFRLRVILQNKGSYIMLFVGIFLASFILMFGLAINPLINHHIDLIEESYVAEYQYLLKAPVPLDNDQQAEEFTIYTMETFCKLGNKDNEVTFYGIAENSKFFTDITIADDEKGIYVSEGLLVKADISIGDTVTFTDPYTDEEYKLKVIGTYDYPAGFAVFMNQQQLNKLLGFDAEYFNGYFSNEELKLDDNYVATIITPDDMTALSDQMLSSFSGMIPIIVSLAVIIYLVLMYILTKVVIDKNAPYISFMKVCGYNEKEIRKLYLRTTTFVVITSLLLSLPLVYLGLKGAFYIAFMKINGYIELYIPANLYLKIVVVGIITYFVINTFHVRHVNRIEMADALKGRD